MKVSKKLFRFGRGLLGLLVLTGLVCRGQEAGGLRVEVAGKQIQVDYQLPGTGVTWNTTYTVSGIDPVTTTTFPGFVGFVSRLNPAADTGIRYKKLVLSDSVSIDGVIFSSGVRSFTYLGPRPMGGQIG